jgi:hypothetical protein
MSISGVSIVREYLHSCAFAGMVLDRGESGIWSDDTMGSVPQVGA